MSEKINAGVIGGAGYVAGELLRLLIYHPQVAIQYVQSTSQKGKKVSDIHTDLAGDCLLTFVEEWMPSIDVLFLCGGHQQSELFLSVHEVPPNIRVIDLSQDFRSKNNRSRFQREFVYGLPEHNKALISDADSIANPGCFATAITLSLIPVLSLIKDEVHIHSITGSTGSGQNLSATTNFNWRNNNVSIYKPFSHQHLGEITETLQEVLPEFNAEINFLPVRGNFTRGIFTSIYFHSAIAEDELISKYKAHYRDDPFVIITDTSPDLKQVVNTNKIFIYPRKIGNKALIISVLDNLLKGASGQAVQNMNLLFNLPETTGLNLKAVAF
ncbi:MAG: N-acetyl-gamma-glutamyl-phosphate reductase [Mucilaginibacter sp.]